MALQFSVTVRNARLDAVETAIGASAVLKIRSGAAPANCATADSGTVLATCSLPSDWMAAASSGSKAKSGTRADYRRQADGLDAIDDSAELARLLQVGSAWLARGITNRAAA